ncbi:hypothetical protein Tco_0122601 [Tanacetum coccineum]
MNKGAHVDAFWSLNEDILKITILKTNTPYPSRKIRLEYGVSTSIGYGVSSSLSNTAYSSQLINTAYPPPLDTAYRSNCRRTRSSTNELFTPYKEPEREFRSSRRHFKTLSLDELRSPDFNLLSDQEYSEEEEAEAMAETMEQYMSKTRTDYGSGVARPKIDNKDQFELKGQFLKIMRMQMNALRKEVILLYNGLDVPTRQILDSRGAIPTKADADAKTAIQEMVEYSQKWHNRTSRGRSTDTSDGLAAIQAQLNCHTQPRRKREV